MDMTETELVVLSACETGLGEAQAGEGVFGLQRAFVIAGARTLLISLWTVPDRSTQELMIDFYERVLAGQHCAEALRDAQLALRKRHPSPIDWGAFICLGNPGPLSFIIPHTNAVIMRNKHARLLDDLDSPDRSMEKEAGLKLVADGEGAIDDLLQSAHEINFRLLTNRGVSSEADIVALNRRIRLLGKIGSTRGIGMIAAALADAADGVAALEAQIVELKSSRRDSPALARARERKSALDSLRRTAFRALVRFGDAAAPTMNANANRVSPPARKEILRVLGRLSWKRFLRGS
ncbi:MAG: hypothetical protein DMF53_27445 [Acidobacteria bacterium]|nr:MAG: hypothetical protein DMF53_27445 [Acidobacteriota bacterium]